jgi:hypothetical protein
LITPYSCSSRTSAGSARVSSSTSSSEYSALPPRTETEARRAARRSGLGTSPSRSLAPRASSWRITRSGRNSSRWSRRIVRRRDTSLDE